LRRLAYRLNPDHLIYAQDMRPRSLPQLPEILLCQQILVGAKGSLGAFSYRDQHLLGKAAGNVTSCEDTGYVGAAGAVDLNAPSSSSSTDLRPSAS